MHVANAHSKNLSGHYAAYEALRQNPSASHRIIVVCPLRWVVSINFNFVTVYMFVRVPIIERLLVQRRILTIAILHYTHQTEEQRVCDTGM